MIYLDHHASAPMHPLAREALTRGLLLCHANPSSVHTAGRAVRGLIERGRAALADALGVSGRDLVFTSGGTEAIDLMVHGVGEGAAVRAVCVDPAAHPALLEAAQALARARGIACSMLPMRRGGAFVVDEIAEFLVSLERPALVALTLVHHETGAIAPWEPIARAANAVGAFCVGDAVQAIGKISVDLGASGLAAAAVSAHKFGGAPGVGVVYLAPGVPMRSRLRGGAQERGLRAGTENVPGLFALEAAARAIPERLEAMRSIATRRDRIERALEGLDGAARNGPLSPRVATVTHLSFDGVAGEELVAAFDLAGFCVSAGPACSSGRAEPSSALRAMYPEQPWRARSALRVSLGPETTDEEVDAFVRAAPRVLAQMRLR